MRVCTFLISLLTVLTSSAAFAAPNSFTYQGRILNANGKPLEYGNVSFLFEITNPLGSCVLYREQVNGINMLNSQGVFDVPIGTGTKIFPEDATSKLLDVFENSKIYQCAGGSSYTAAAGDTRLLKVQFHDGQGWRVISPSNEIRSVPFSAYAQSAETLGNKRADDFIIKTGIPSCNANEFLNWNGTELKCAPVTGASGGTVTSVKSASPHLTITSTTSDPLIQVNVGTSSGTVAAGDDIRFTDPRAPIGAAGGDLFGNYPDPKVTKIQSHPVDGATPTEGQVLLWQDTTWKPQFVRMQDIRNAWGDTSMIPNENCSANESMVWNVITDKFKCQSIGLLNASAISEGVLDMARLGATIGDAAKYLRGDGTWSAISTEDTSKLPLLGGVMAGDINLNGHKIINIANVPYVPVAPTASESGLSLRWNGAAWEWFSAVDLAKNELEDTGITAGEYTKVTVDKKGRVLAGTTLEAGDIPDLDWSKITTGKPTTLSDYGITDSVALSNDPRFVDSRSPKGAAGGDLSGNYPDPSVVKIQGKPISTAAPAIGEVLKFDGAKWVPSSVNLTAEVTGTLGIAHGGTGVNSFLPNRLIASDGTGSTLTTFTCGDGKVISFDIMGVMTCSSLRLSSFFVNGGNAFGGDATLGTTDNSSLTLITNNSARVFIDSAGRVGIGTSTPGQALTVAGVIESTVGGFKFPDGSVQTTAVIGELGTVKLIPYAAAPFACDASKDGAFAMTSIYGTCACHGAASTWVSSSTQGACVWAYHHIVADGAGRGWSDGTYAKSCNAYKNPKVGYVYTGEVGDGIYTIDVDGEGPFQAVDVYCDMTTDSGGWTRVFNDQTENFTTITGDLGEIEITAVMGKFVGKMAYGKVNTPGRVKNIIASTAWCGSVWGTCNTNDQGAFVFHWSSLSNGPKKNLRILAANGYGAGEIRQIYACDCGQCSTYIWHQNTTCSGVYNSTAFQIFVR